MQFSTKSVKPISSSLCSGWLKSAVLLSILQLAGACTPTDKTPTNAQANESADVIITHANVYAAPGAPLQNNQTLVISNGLIVSLGPGTVADDSLPAKRHIDAAGKILSAGFWNAHVHLTDAELATAPAKVIEDMLLRYGFTHIVDTGSTLAQTLALRDAVRAKRLPGPYMVLANGSFVYTDGTPSYLPGLNLPEVGTPEAAAPMINGVLDAGADGIKIFAGSFVTPQHTIHLPQEIIRAIVEAAASQDTFVMAHPTTLEGLSNAVGGGVGIIAHTTAPETDMANELLEQMRHQGTAVIPTLKLWRSEMEKFNAGEAQANFMENSAVTQLAIIHKADIVILFGTDVGYMRDFDTTAEFQLMQRAGMDWSAIHRSLTTGPASHFGRFVGDGHSAGVIRAGAPANLVLLQGDPAQDITALARVYATIVDGRIVYEAASH